MDKFVIEGQRPLRGAVEISGSKNAALPILAAALLSTEPLVIKNVPDLWDVHTMLKILGALGVTSSKNPAGEITLNVADEKPDTAPYELVKTMRASFCVLGPLLARRKRARVSLPGGCVIGPRPVDLHLKGLKALGARIEIEDGYVVAEATQLKGTEIYLAGANGSSVLATANVVMAAVLAEGKTTIINAACEPEIHDLMQCLNNMGARISGVGTPIVTIQGVESLHGAVHDVIPDRIEGGTFLVAGAITNSSIEVKKCRPAHLAAVVDKMSQMGIHVEMAAASCRVIPSAEIRPADITTLPYPGFPTDLQAQFIALLALTHGISLVTERIFPDRFMHIAEMGRMGARIRKEGATAVIEGVQELRGAPVMASDLRASAALVLAGLAARGTSEIQRVYHIDRGYESIEKKLNALGARIERTKDEE